MIKKRFENSCAGLYIRFEGTEFQEKIRKAGGKWNSNRKLREIVYEKVPDGPKERIVEVTDVSVPDPGGRDL